MAHDGSGSRGFTCGNTLFTSRDCCAAVTSVDAITAAVSTVMRMGARPVPDKRLPLPTAAQAQARVQGSRDTQKVSRQPILGEGTAAAGCAPPPPPHTRAEAANCCHINSQWRSRHVRRSGVGVLARVPVDGPRKGWQPPSNLLMDAPPGHRHGHTRNHQRRSKDY